MSVDAIVSATAALAAPVMPAAGAANVAGQTGQFMEMVTKGLGEVNQQLISTQTGLQQLAVGDVQNLHQVMIQMEEARMSFQLLVQVRNRVLETYQDLMKMSV
ncbi:flagellar hook-basal body complex protein FliE [Herbaspirillum autotrophicum]|uniref:flagellar hook-basal body complex protein FliE n=1 Tax=Herbaspirillum autotrophicum TaxID=180195 RepID=UPI00067AB9FB|nr:flagellar hook-basal body complex protein FliE [Herbaspirillum autotrophicum]